MKPTLIIILGLFILSCSSEPDEQMPVVSNDCEISEGTISGKVLNKDFTLLTATASYYSSDDEYQIFLFGTDEINATDPCDVIGVQGSQITFFIDNAPKEDSSIATLFNAGTMSLETSNVCFIIESITNNLIVGKLTIEDTEGRNEVSGSWEAIICE